MNVVSRTDAAGGDGARSVAVQLLIDAKRAQLLWHNASPAAEWVSGGLFSDTFEVPGAAGLYVHDFDPVWEAGRLMWCDGALEAMLLADYEQACGFRTRLLWDPGAPGWDACYVVMSSRPYRDIGDAGAGV